MRTFIIGLVALIMWGVASQHAIAQETEATSPTMVTILSVSSASFRQLVAQSYPPIPDWLVVLPASEMDGAVALPDGRWVIRTYDHLPLDHPDFPGLEYESWYLYDADGNRVPFPNTPRGSGWEEQVWADGYYDTMGNSPYFTVDEDNVTNCMGAAGYLFIFDPGDPAKPILEAYDQATGTLLYDKRYDLACILPQRQFRYCEIIDRDRVLNLAAQQASAETGTS